MEEVEEGAVEGDDRRGIGASRARNAGMDAAET